MSELNYLEINNQKIPYVLKSYKTSKHIKLFFRDGILHITKPKRISKTEALAFANSNSEFIVDTYGKSVNKLKSKYKNWKDGETILFGGEAYKIVKKQVEQKRIKVSVNPTQKEFVLSLPNCENDDIPKEKIDVKVKSFLKEHTSAIVEERLPYWSEKMGLKYMSYRITDTTSKYGSCIPSLKKLQFSTRLSMFPKDVVDAIIVHELAHLSHKNHDEKFYTLVKAYMPDYKEKDKWLKQNSEKIYI